MLPAPGIQTDFHRTLRLTHPNLQYPPVNVDFTALSAAILSPLVSQQLLHSQNHLMSRPSTTAATACGANQRPATVSTTGASETTAPGPTLDFSHFTLLPFHYLATRCHPLAADAPIPWPLPDTRAVTPSSTGLRHSNTPPRAFTRHLEPLLGETFVRPSSHGRPDTPGAADIRSKNTAIPACEPACLTIRLDLSHCCPSSLPPGEVRLSSFASMALCIHCQ